MYPTEVARLNFRTDRDIDLFVRDYARKNQITTSQAARELLRQIIGRAKPITRGWHEGFNKGYADAQKAAHQALAGTPLPDED